MSLIDVNDGVVLVVDDSAEVRDGLKALVESVGLRCMVFGSADEFFQYDEDGCKCLILDVRLPKMSGLDLQDELNRTSRNIPTIIVSGHGDIPMTVRAMKAGAVTFLTKPLREQDVLDAIYTAMLRDRVRLEREQKTHDLRSRLKTLTVRQRGILPLLAAGLPNREIADQIGVSEEVVKYHRRNLMVKLQTKTLPDLMRIADALGVRHADAQTRRHW